jgi:hypothetical protein
MAAKLTRLTHKIAIQLHLVTESCTICNSRSRRSVRRFKPRSLEYKSDGSDLFLVYSFVNAHMFKQNFSFRVTVHVSGPPVTVRGGGAGDTDARGRCEPGDLSGRLTTKRTDRMYQVCAIRNEHAASLYHLVRVKVKVKLSLCLTKHHAMKAYWGVEI